MKLEKTRLCIQCEELVAIDEHASCPRCGSHVLMPLTTWVPSAAHVREAVVVANQKWRGAYQRMQEARDRKLTSVYGGDGGHGSHCAL